MNGKKILRILVLFLVLTMVLSACTTPTAAPTAAPTKAPVVATEAPVAEPPALVTSSGYVVPAAACAPNCTYKDMVVGFIQTGPEGAWRTANNASFDEAATQLGITLKVYDSQGKVENQISAFHTFNQDPTVNVILLASVDTKGFDDVLKKLPRWGRSSSWKTAALIPLQNSTTPVSDLTSSSKVKRVAMKCASCSKLSKRKMWLRFPVL